MLKSLLSQLGRIKKTLLFWWRFKSLKRACTYTFSKIGKLATTCEIRGDLYFFPEIDIAVRDLRNEVWSDGFLQMKRLRERGAAFTLNKAGTLIASTSGVNLEIHTLEELQILEEVFFDCVYSFFCGQSCVVLDIGMNTAFASIFFASQHPDAVIFSYEPFTPTFEQAVKNITSNPLLSKRINPNLYGVDSHSHSETLPYSTQWRGSIGLFGVPKWLASKSEAQSIVVQFNDIVPEIDRVKSEFPDRHVVIKIDCEGAEYGIITRLAEAGRLSLVEIILMECHIRDQGHDPGALRDMLVSHGFNCIHLNPHSEDISMIYAFRKSAS